MSSIGFFYLVATLYTFIAANGIDESSNENEKDDEKNCIIDGSTVKNRYVEYFRQLLRTSR